MATTKTAALTFRIHPGLKEALRTPAHQEHCSIASMVDGVDAGLLRTLWQCDSRAARPVS